MKKSESVAIIVCRMGLEPWIMLRSEALELAWIEAEEGQLKLKLEDEERERV